MHNNILSIQKKNIDLICLADKIIYYFHVQNYDTALRMSSVVINELSSHLEVLLSSASYFNEEYQLIDQQVIINILKSLLDAIENKDYVLLADLYEIQLIPFLIRLQEIIAGKEGVFVNNNRYIENLAALKENNSWLASYMKSLPDPIYLLEKGYNIECTSCGLMTLALEDKDIKYYMHSNNHTQNEAFTLAISWYTEDVNEYIIYGLGLGYHIEALNDIDSNIIIKVYESDVNIIQIACLYTDLYKIVSKPNIQLIYDPDYKKLLYQIQNLNNSARFLIHYPSLRNIKDTAIREKLENYFLQYSSIENQRKLLNGNFRENIHNYDALIDELRDEFQGKNLYIVAAGPSLDKNYQQLKEINKTNSIILATGTVFRKLLNAGITPDYVIVTDANPRVYHQISGYENSEVPMLYLSSAYRGFAQNYQGKKYIILQKDYDKAEAYANENNAILFQTGGSVSTTALDIGITFGCKRIIFLGLDLAYTGDYVHASGTSRRELASTEDLRQVTDINGNKVYTSKSLDIYRHWIENRIRNVKGIEFVDATEGGAKIEGMKIMKLSECISSVLKQ